MSKALEAQKRKLEAMQSQAEAGTADVAPNIVVPNRPSVSKAAQAIADKLQRTAVTTEQDDVPMVDENRYQIVKEQLEQDIKALSKLKIVAEKVDFKAKRVDEYLEYLSEYAAAGYDHQNLVLSHMPIWLFDLGRVEDAVKWAELAAETGQKAPAGFSGSFHNAITGLLKDFLEAEYADENYHFDLARFAVEGIAGDDAFWDVNKVRAGEFLALAGKHAEALELLDDAEFCYTNALALNKKAGCKGRLDDVKKLKAQQEA